MSADIAMLFAKGLPGRGLQMWRKQLAGLSTTALDQLGSQYVDEIDQMESRVKEFESRLEVLKEQRLVEMIYFLELHAELKRRGHFGDPDDPE